MQRAPAKSNKNQKLADVVKRGLLSGSLLGCCLTDKCLLPARFVICFGPASRLLMQALQLGLFRLVLLLLRQRFTQGC